MRAAIIFSSIMIHMQLQNFAALVNGLEIQSKTK